MVVATDFIAVKIRSGNRAFSQLLDRAICESVHWDCRRLASPRRALGRYRNMPLCSDKEGLPLQIAGLELLLHNTLKFLIHIMKVIEQNGILVFLKVKSFAA